MTALPTFGASSARMQRAALDIATAAWRDPSARGGQR